MNHIVTARSISGNKLLKISQCRCKMDSADWAILSAARITFDGFQYEKDLFSKNFIPQKKRVMGTRKVPYDRKSAE